MVADELEPLAKKVAEILLSRQAELSIIQHRQLTAALGSLCEALDLCGKIDTDKEKEERQKGVQQTLKTAGEYGWVPKKQHDEESNNYMFSAIHTLRGTSPWTDVPKKDKQDSSKFPPGHSSSNNSAWVPGPIPGPIVPNTFLKGASQESNLGPHAPKASIITTRPLAL